MLRSSVCFLFVLLAGSACIADDHNLVNDVFEEWNKRAASWQTLLLRTRFEQFIAANSIPDLDDGILKYPLKDTSFTGTIEYQFDLKGHRYRRKGSQHIFNASTKSFDAEVYVSLFDGTHFQVFNPKQENIDWGNSRSQSEYWIELTLFHEKRAPFFSSLDSPVFYAIGLVPARGFDMKKGQVTPPDLSKAVARRTKDILMIEFPIGKRSVIDERYEIDPTTLLVKSMRKYVSGMEGYSLEIEYKERDGKFFPFFWVEREYEFKDEHRRLMKETKVSTIEAVVDGPMILPFSVTPTPGMNVLDVSTDVEYRVPDPGKPLETLGEIFAREEHAPRPIGWITLAFWSAIGCAAFLGLYIFLKIRGV